MRIPRGSLLWTGVIAILLVTVAPTDAQPAEVNAPGKPADNYDARSSIGPHHKWIKRTGAAKKKQRGGLAAGDLVQLESGLHYWADGQWKESSERIELGADGSAIARSGPYLVTFAPNLASVGAIDLVGPDGKRTRSHVLGLNYFDAESGKSVQIAEVKESIGEIQPPNQVLYRDAMKGVRCDIRYTYRKGSFEQDAILLEDPPSPGDLGLNPATTRLEVWTEFLDAPQPTRDVRAVKEPAELQRKAAMAEPVLSDERIGFGAMQIGWGRAFAVETGEAQGAARNLEEPLPVFKRWERLEDRDFLIEAVEYPSAKGHFQRLPKATQPKRDARINRGRVAPSRRLASRSTEGIQMATTTYQPRGFVVDYVSAYTAANFTFSSGTTYWVSGEITMSGITTIQSGTFIKLAPGGSVKVNSDTFVTPASGKAYIVSESDPIGQIIDPDRAPATLVGNPALHLYYTTNAAIQNLEFRHLTKAIRDYSPSPAYHTLQACTFIDCTTAIETYWTSGQFLSLASLSVCNVYQPYVNAGGNPWYGYPSGPLPTACDDRGGLPSSATTVALGSSATGDISYAGDVDYFRVVISTAGTYSFYTTGSTDTYGYLVNSSGTTLASNDDDSLAANFVITSYLTPGTYYVCVRDYYTTMTTGAYTLYAQVNSNPTISDIPDQTVDEDSAASTLNFTIADAETENIALTLSVTSSNPTLVPVSPSSFGGSGANRTITFQPTANASGSSTITVTVSDKAATASDSFVVTVQPQTQIPSLGLGFDTDHTVATVTGTGAPGATVRYTVDGSNPTAASSSVPPQLSTAGTVKARAFLTGYAPSDIATIPIAVTAGVVFSSSGHGPTQYSVGPMNLTMTAESLANVRYKAGTSGAWITGSSGVPVTLDGIDSGNGTVQAFAYTAGKLRSAPVTSGEFSLRLPPPISTVNYAANGYASGTLTLSCPGVSGATLRYTTDGSVPGPASTVYSAPLTYSSPTRVYARAYKTGYVPSSYSSAFVNQLPGAKVAGTGGLITGNITVNDSVDVWILPNLGFDNAYGEEMSANGWSMSTYSADAPNAAIRGSFVGSAFAETYSTKRVNMSWGRSFTVSTWLRHVSGTSTDGVGLMNFTSAGTHITGWYVHEYGGGITYLTQPLSSGQTVAYVADESIFLPLDPNWYGNLFVPLTAFGRTTEIQGLNQPAGVADIFQSINWGLTTSPYATAVSTPQKSVTLSIPYSGATLPINTVIAKRPSSGKYQYITFPISPTTWTKYDYTTSTLRSGTEQAAALVLLSKDGAVSSMTGYELWEGALGDRPKLHYTVDGNAAVYSTLGVSGPVKITLTGNHEGTLNIGQRGTYYQDASVVQRVITFQVATPTVTFVPSGVNQFVVTATSTTPSPTLRYTLDGSEPTTSSTLYAGAFTINATQTVKVKGFKTNYTPSATAGRLGIPTFNPAGATFAGDVNLNITAAPGSTQVKILQSNPSLVSPATWVYPSQGGQPGFNPSSGSQTAENSIEMGATPFERTDKLWVAASLDAAQDADGGWTTVAFAVDKTKTYRFSAWIKKAGSGLGWTALGAGPNSVSTLTGSTSESIAADPNFSIRQVTTLGQWQYVVGYVHPAGHVGTTHYSKIYDQAGNVLAAGTDFKWLNTTTTSNHRAYLWGSTDTLAKQYIWDPRVEVVSSAGDPPLAVLAATVNSPRAISITGNLNNVVSAISVSSSPTLQSSPTEVQTYTFQAAAPVVTLLAGGTLQATTATSGAAEIRYTTDGSDPIATSTLYTVPITPPAGTSRWKAFKANYTPSTTTAYTYTVVDADADGMADSWENSYFGSLGQPSSGDPDGDGFTNVQEYGNGTNPTIPDPVPPGGGPGLIVFTPRL